ncbi:MAG: N-acetylmuramic acid 6-phosphate etherase [uncultured Thermomicrobiales bacterium]|uniref:N-acetylmuramic acid 6-phosphate etherase n=1 Tax=uncultured Thermomicrobiales bacterium TaxID=1645740 RepID=A0A6J4VU14_9BACT|nr:MAG: N-acetylmuramic acid 6-phosphate etherase [uncultured Thermomicrobiales bacterium]
MSIGSGMEQEDSVLSPQSSALPETERANPRTARIDEAATADILRLMNDEDARVAAAVRATIPQIARAVDELAARIGRGGHLLLFGAGTSGRLAALDAAEWPPTFGTPPELARAFIAGGPIALTQAVEGAEDRAELGQEDVRTAGVGPDDLALAISASGGAPYVLGAMREARVRGAFTVGLTCRAGSPLEAMVDVAIVPLVGPEVLAGSSRLKAGTAQKLVLNMLSTATMVRLGKVYRNLMIDVQPTNTKLRARAVRIVQGATGATPEAAAAALAAAGDTRSAIVMLRLGLDAAAARERARSSTRLSEVLGE